MGHGGTLNKIRNIEALFERAAGVYLLKCHPLDVVRKTMLAQLIHDDEYNYSLPYDFGVLIDLIPEDHRDNWDATFRQDASHFDLEKAIRQKTVSIEGSEGTKIIRINWRTRRGKVLNTMDSLNGNGTWTGVGGATNVILDTIYKVSGNGSIRFDLVTTGDGIQNSSMSQLDLTTESGVAHVFIPMYFPTAPTSVTAIWGNDLTTNFWTSAAVTAQADGTALTTGWNYLKFPWSSAIQSGTVDPSKVDSFEIKVASPVAIPKIRVDNIIFSIGRPFDMKYYSKYLFKSASTGIWISRPASDNDLTMVDNDTIAQFLFECLQEMAQQMEGTDGAFDIGFARQRLMEIYPAYKGLYPPMNKKPTQRYGSRKPGRCRW